MSGWNWGLEQRATVHCTYDMYTLFFR